MLVLGRKVGERIRIGPSIYVTVVAISRGRARIGIDAPDDVEVVREELDPPHKTPPAPVTGAPTVQPSGAAA